MGGIKVAGVSALAVFVSHRQLDDVLGTKQHIKGFTISFWSGLGGLGDGGDVVVACDAAVAALKRGVSVRASPLSRYSVRVAGKGYGICRAIRPR